MSFQLVKSTIHVQCEDPHVLCAVNDWLDSAELSPPMVLELELAVGDPEQEEPDERTPFTQPCVEIRTGPPAGDVRISWLVEPAVAVILPGEDRARATLSGQAIERLEECIHTFLLTVVIFLLRRAGWHHVHAVSARDPQGRGWLIAGNAKAGKSTTAALLASRGWEVGTDDSAFIVHDEDRIAIVAYRAPISLRDGGYELLGSKDGTFQQRRQKMVYWPEELGGTWLPRVEPDILVFPSVGASDSLSEAVSAREALTELVRWSAWVVLEPKLAQEHLDLLTRLASQAKAYRVTLGRDLFEDPNRLRELIP